MGTVLKRIGGVLALLCLVLTVVADDPPFPHMTDLEIEFYETEVQITDLNKQVFGIANEYYDNTTPRGKMELRAVGETKSVFYDKDTNEILEMKESNCQAWDIDESLYVYEAIFYGWLNADPLIIGPSAALWMANDKRKDIVYAGKKRVRSILCDSYTLRVQESKEDVTFTYYFAGTDWETPYKMDELRVPIRIDASGKSSKDIPINISTDFFYFRPYISDWLIFQPPLGIGCPLKKPTKTMPSMPKVFKYSAEIVDVIKTESENPVTYNIQYQQVWYDSIKMIARLDKHNATSFSSELYDFNTGVTYSTENDNRTCKIKPLRNSFFEVYDNQMIGRFKEPNEILNLDGTFYYMGKRLFRGIMCDSFESVQMDVTFMKQNVSKLVVTIFYSQDIYEVQVDGETETKVPVYYMVTGYKENKKVFIRQTNIFEFDDVIYPPMHTSYNLEKCFPSSKDKSYFVLLVNVGTELTKKMELQDDLVKEMLIQQIAKYAKISDMRIRSLSIVYDPTGISITGLMLERPPTLKQFFMEFEGRVEVADKYLKPVINADTEEKCASACIDNDYIQCLGIHFCQKVCFLKSKGIFEEKEDNEETYDLGKYCRTWMRVTRDSVNREANLVDALKSLQNAVMDKKLEISLLIDDKTEVIIPIEDISIGDRDSTGPPFPDISVFELYETEVQITDINQQVLGIANEYFDNTAPRGKMELKALGDTVSVFYDKDTNEILEVQDSNCQAWDIDESSYGYEATFYGWLNVDPLIIGPSAALWMANNKRKDIVYAGKKRVRNIMCDSYTLHVQESKEDVILTYYFAGADWETPFQIDRLRVPIRIEANGKSSKGIKDSVSIPIKISTDFFYFRPYISNWLVFEPPLGIGCPLKKPTVTMPSMPKVFKYSAEIVDVINTDSENPGTYNIQYEQVWYNSVRMIARLDKHNATSFTSELYDFNTGVTYSTENDNRTCKIKPLRNSFFEVYDNQMIGRLKEPNEILNLDGTFYYMGKRLFRGIMCDSFESVQMDVTFMKQDVSKLVVTIFYSQDIYGVQVDGETETKVPVYYMVTGYKENKKIINLQYNIFAFDDVIYPAMHNSYNLEKCFPSSRDKSYFALVVKVGEETVKKINLQDDMVKEILIIQIAKYAKVSDMRIRSLSIEYDPPLINVRGLMLERPPTLKQFFMEFEGKVEVADKYLKPAVNADTEEKCASACIDNDDFQCLGFYFCNSACILKSKGIFEEKEDNEKTFDLGESCRTWMRVTRDSVNREANLVDALKSLQNAVMDKKLQIRFIIDNEREEIIAIEDIFIDKLPYDGPPFPNISEVEFYETEVQITDLNQRMFAKAKEYYDRSAPRGKLELKGVGSTQSVFYNNDTNEILEMNETTCQAWDVDESEYDYQDIFFGWKNTNPLIIGPSAALWLANNKRREIVYKGQKKVRTIRCDSYQLFIRGSRANITLTYYFAVIKWKTPFQMDKMRVPIRIEAYGMSSKDTGDASLSVPINIISDFSYFRPTISDWLVFQPPLGLGCHLKKPTRTMPSMPKVFTYSAEVFDVMTTDAKNPKYTYDVEYQQVWYDNKRRMARLDKYSNTSYFSELHDFNTGVTYNTENGRSCKIKPLRNSFFEAYDNQLIGHLKEPGEVLNLDRTFYYMGKRLIRAIWCDSFESVQMNVVFMKQSLSKLVVTIFYSQDFYQVVSVDGDIETRVPVYYMVTGYKDNKKIINLQYNIFEFSNAIWPDMYTSYSLERCFPSLKDKSYFVLSMNVGKELSKKLKSKDDLVKELLRGQITKYANISDMRIPLLSVDYKSTSLSVTGLMLDRSPALKQFFMEFEGEVEIVDKHLKPVISADTEEKCAFACLDNNGFTCMGFYFCNKFCFLKSKGIFDKKEKDEKTIDSGETCKTWTRVTLDAKIKEANLVDALRALENAVIDQKMKIGLKLDEKTEKVILIEQIVIGEGPYTGIGQDKPYDIVVNFVKMNEDMMTTTKVEYVDNVNDCYKACKNSDTLACASFSFCPSALNKECMLSSTLFIDKKTNPDATKEDKNCYIYSRKYVDMYEPYPGRVALISGDDAFNAVGTLEECARKCRESTKVKCRGFEYCRSTEYCILHARHILDLKSGEMTADKKSNCLHYAAKYMSDYDDMGYTFLDDNSDVRGRVTLEECAKICSEELKSSCKSFNYCPSSQLSEDSSCALSTRILKDSTGTSKDKCRHFEKKKVIDDWKKPIRKVILESSGYTAKGFTRLVIGMLVLGLIVGTLGYVGYSRYRSKPKVEGFAVSFKMQPTQSATLMKT